jgi:hypothetical protein
MAMSALTTDVWRREHEPIAPRSTTATVPEEGSTVPEEGPTPDRTIYDVLREILPRYDLAAIAERAEGLSLLSHMDAMAAERERSMSSEPDSVEDQSEQTAISESLAPGQLDSIARREDESDE